MKKVYFLGFALTLLSACGGETTQKPSSEQKAVQAVSEKVEEGQDAPANKSVGTAAFAFEETSYEFGEIKEGESVTHVFKFTNEGEAPLIIQSAKGSCGCTVPEYPEEPIAPGAKGEIKVVFNSTGKSGTQNKTVTLMANTEEETTVLTIKGRVVPNPAATKDMKGPLKQ